MVKSEEQTAGDLRVEKEASIIGELNLDDVEAAMRELARDSMPMLLVESLRIEDVTRDEDGVWMTISGYKDGLYHDVEGKDVR